MSAVGDEKASCVDSRSKCLNKSVWSAMTFYIEKNVLCVLEWSRK